MLLAQKRGQTAPGTAAARRRRWKKRGHERGVVGFVEESKRGERRNMPCLTTASAGPTEARLQEKEKGKKKDVRGLAVGSRGGRGDARS